MDAVQPFAVPAGAKPAVATFGLTKRPKSPRLIKLKLSIKGTDAAKRLHKQPVPCVLTDVLLKLDEDLNKADFKIVSIRDSTSEPCLIGADFIVSNINMDMVVDKFLMNATMDKSTGILTVSMTTPADEDEEETDEAEDDDDKIIDDSAIRGLVRAARRKAYTPKRLYTPSPGGSDQAAPFVVTDAMRIQTFMDASLRVLEAQQDLDMIRAQMTEEQLKRIEAVIVFKKAT